MLEYAIGKVTRSETSKHGQELWIKRIDCIIPVKLKAFVIDAKNYSGKDSYVQIVYDTFTGSVIALKDIGDPDHMKEHLLSEYKIY